LWFQKTRCIKLSNGVTSNKLFDSEGNFEVQLWRIPDAVLFSMLLHEIDDIVVIPKDPVYQAFERCHIKQTIWFRGQFWSPTMKDSRRRVIFNTIARDWRHRSDSKRPSVTSYRIELRKTIHSIWFTGQFLNKIILDSRRRVISHDFGSEPRHRCWSERPVVPTTTKDAVLSWL
jgi:hypothetical protein